LQRAYCTAELRALICGRGIADLRLRCVPHSALVNSCAARNRFHALRELLAIPLWSFKPLANRNRPFHSDWAGRPVLALSIRGSTSRPGEVVPDAGRRHDVGTAGRTGAGPAALSGRVETDGGQRRPASGPIRSQRPVRARVRPGTVDTTV